jgi:cbb3-type cytochrome oxidase subunit 3
MPLWGQVLVGLAALYLVTILHILYLYWKQKQESVKELAELFALKEGQTIMAVVDEKNTLYFCIGRDG